MLQTHALLKILQSKYFILRAWPDLITELNKNNYHNIDDFKPEILNPNEKIREKGAGFYLILILMIILISISLISPLFGLSPEKNNINLGLDCFDIVKNTNNLVTNPYR